MNADTLTQSHLKELLHYDPDTGVFTRKVTRSGRAKAGDVAGFTVHGYRGIMIAKKNYRCHRLAFLYMTGRFPEAQIDHINGNRSDNRWINLRQANNAENMRNRGRQSNNTSGFKGVNKKTDHARKNPWRATIHLNGKSKSIGHFKTPEEAYAAYSTAADKIHGDFAHH